MKNFYEESWFKRLGILICALLLILSFAISNLLVLLLPFILAAVYGVLNPGGAKDCRFYVRVCAAMMGLPFVLAAVAIAGSGLKGMWFGDYSSMAWAVIFNGALVYAGAVFLAAVLLWIFKGRQDRRQGKDDLEKLSFVTLEPRQPSLTENLPQPNPGDCRLSIVIPINKKTRWVRLPCLLTNEGTLPVVALGVEAVNSEITGTSALDHPVLMPPAKTVGIDLYVPVTEARHLEIKCSFTNVLGETTVGILALTRSEELYYGKYNLRMIG